jgi:hypothetical protein
MNPPDQRAGGVTEAPPPLTLAERQADRAANAQRRLLLGDKVEAIVKPLAKALNLPCLDTGGQLRPESGCAKRRDWLNGLA